MEKEDPDLKPEELEEKPKEVWKKPRFKSTALPLFNNVFLDISTETGYLGRIVINLYQDCPKTSENFRCLCTGEKKIAGGHNLHYKGTVFHRILSNLMIQAGDTHREGRETGTGGESIYGRFFPDENFKHLHDKAYKIAMANMGEPNTNSS